MLIISLISHAYGAETVDAGSPPPPGNSESEEDQVLRKTFYKYQWQLVDLSNSKGKYYMVCPQGVFKLVRCYPDDSPTSDDFTFLEEDLERQHGLPVSLISTIETDDGDLDVLYKLREKGEESFLRPPLGYGINVTRINGADGLNRSARSIKKSRKSVSPQALTKPVETSPSVQPVQDPSVLTKVYFKWQWQLASIDQQVEYYMVCPTGVFKGMFCYPDITPLTHVDFTFLEEDLAKIAKRPVKVIAATATPNGDLNVTYQTKGAATFVRPNVSKNSFVYSIKGEDGMGKSAALAARNRWQEPDNTKSEGIPWIVWLALLLIGVFLIKGFDYFISNRGTSVLNQIRVPSEVATVRQTEAVPVDVASVDRLETVTTTVDGGKVKRKVFLE